MYLFSSSSSFKEEKDEQEEKEEKKEETILPRRRREVLTSDMSESDKRDQMFVLDIWFEEEQEDARKAEEKPLPTTK